MKISEVLQKSQAKDPLTGKPFAGQTYTVNSTDGRATLIIQPSGPGMMDKLIVGSAVTLSQSDYVLNTSGRIRIMFGNTVDDTKIESGSNAQSIKLLSSGLADKLLKYKGMFAVEVSTYPMNKTVVYRFQF